MDSGIEGHPPSPSSSRREAEEEEEEEEREQQRSAGGGEGEEQGMEGGEEERGKEKAEDHHDRARSEEERAQREDEERRDEKEREASEKAKQAAQATLEKREEDRDINESLPPICLSFKDLRFSIYARKKKTKGQARHEAEGKAQDQDGQAEGQAASSSSSSSASPSGYPPAGSGQEATAVTGEELHGAGTESGGTVQGGDDQGKKRKKPGLLGLPFHPGSLSLFGIGNAFGKVTGLLGGKAKKEKRELLHGVTGHFLPGRLAAVMGPSGAGKSLLLNILSGRLRKGEVKGEVLTNGVDLKRDLFKYISAYVMQDDTLLGNLTPRELVSYSAALRLPRTMSAMQKKERVDQVIDQLRLSKVRDTQVGIPGVKRGVSGGERRRVSVALELIINPRILFLDEPTSGLDSATAEIVVSILRDLARQGRTVICTIHQPSTDIFEMFDDVFWLVDGRLVYSGPVDQTCKYFKKAGYACPKFCNPADFVIRLLTKSMDESEEDFRQRQEKLIRFYEEHNNIVPMEGYRIQGFEFNADGEVSVSSSSTSDLHALDARGRAEEQTSRSREEAREEGASAGGEQGTSAAPQEPSAQAGRDTEEKKPEKPSDLRHRMTEQPLNKRIRSKVEEKMPLFHMQFWILLQRSWKQYIRDPAVTWQRLFQSAFIAVFVGLLFLQIDNNQEGIQNQVGVLFLLIINAAFQTGNAALELFPSERPIFLREYQNGMYSVGAYYLAKSLVDLPFQIIYPTITTTVIYWMVGLRANFARYLVLLADIIIIANVCQSLGFVVSILFELRYALALFPTVLIPLMLVGGLFINVQSIPVYFIWLQYISFIFYSFVAAAQNQFSGETYQCDPSELVGDLCPITEGEQVLGRYGIDVYPIWVGFIGLLAAFAVMRVIAFLELLYLARTRSAL